MSEESFSERLARIKREKEAAGLSLVPEGVKVKEPATPRAPKEAFDPDLVPEMPYERTEQDEELDGIIDGIDILEAYRRWCGKMEPRVGNRRESIMVSCPKPEHPDREPSAWINLDKETWFCGGCQEGGDKFDIAAYHFGFPVPGYKEGKTFHELRERIGTDSGYIVRHTPTGATYLEKIEDEEPEQDSPPTGGNPEPVPEVESSPDSTDEPLATVTAISPAVSVEYVTPEAIPSLPWRDLFDGDSFIRTYCDESSKLPITEEYFVWMGLQAVGMACGYDLHLDTQTPVRGNLMVCLVGSTGAGKTRASATMFRLVEQALPYSTDPGDTGTRFMASPGSGEALADAFSKPIEDPADAKKVAYYDKVRGMVMFDEMASLMTKVNRTGSTLGPVVMGLFDGHIPAGTLSRGHGDVHVTDPFMSALSTTQKRSIRDVLRQQDSNSGFANRWVYVMGPEKARSLLGGATLNYSRAEDQLRAIRNWASRLAASGGQVTVDPTIAPLIEAYYRKEIAPLESSDAIEAGMYGRMSLLFLKIMLLMAADLKTALIDEKIAERAMVLHRYLLQTNKLVGQKIGSTDESELEENIQERIRELCKAHGTGGVSGRIIYKSLRRQFQSHKEFMGTLKALVALGFIEEYVPKRDTGKRGPAPVMYRVPGEEAS